MYYRFISYLQFLFSATNQHGVHSPFVYKYVTQCLYKRKPTRGTKSKRAFYKSIPYFNAKNISVSQKDPFIAETIIKQFPELKFDQAPLDLIYLAKPDRSFLENKNVHNDTVVFLDNIHRTKENTEIWKELILSPHLSVTMDLYYCGVVFFRKEQVKEHFKIRI